MISVTKVLGRYFPFPDTIPKHILENARQRGLAVHTYMEEYNKFLQGIRKNKPNIPLEHQIYADYYEEFVAKHNFKPTHTEIKLDNGVFRGVIDIIGEIDGELVIIDLKVTYALNKPYVELQSSAYKHLAVHHKLIKDNTPQKVLHMNKKGWSLTDLEDKYDIFEKMLAIEEYLK